MPQKPQDRAKEKRRLTRRLANWRAKKAAATATPETKPTAKAKTAKG